MRLKANWAGKEERRRSPALALICQTIEAWLTLSRMYTSIKGTCLCHSGRISIVTACSVLCSTDVVCKLCRKAAKSSKSHVNIADRFCCLSKAQRREKSADEIRERERCVAGWPTVAAPCPVLNRAPSKPGALYIRVSIGSQKLAYLQALGDSPMQQHPSLARTLSILLTHLKTLRGAVCF